MPRHDDESLLGTLLGRMRPKTNVREETEKYRQHTQEFRRNVRHDTTLGDDNISQELVQLFIVADGELQVARNDTEIEDA